jgi:hypothetical protein
MHAWPRMPAGPSTPTPPRRVQPWAPLVALLIGAAMGAATGPVAGCQLSAALGSLGGLATGGGGCPPVGGGVGALAGALLGGWALPLLGVGAAAWQPPAARPAATTRAAVWLLVAAVVAAVGLWAAAWAAVRRGGAGLEALGVLLIGVAGAVGGVVLLGVAWGLLRRRGWARWAATVACSLGGVVALSWLLHPAAALLHRLEGPQVQFAPRGTDLIPPGVFLLVSVAVVVLLLVPATGRDFQAGEQPAPQGDRRRQAGG